MSVYLLPSLLILLMEHNDPALLAGVESPLLDGNRVFFQEYWVGLLRREYGELGAPSAGLLASSLGGSTAIPILKAHVISALQEE
jgi:hypothetical protein